MITTKQYAERTGALQYKVAEQIATGKLAGRLVGHTYLMPDPDLNVDPDWERLMTGELVTINEYAANNGKTPTTIKMRVRNGKLPCIKVGSTILVERDTDFSDNRISSGKYVGWRKK